MTRTHHPQQALVNAAIGAGTRAYAPYSGYRVGAAVQCADGSVFTGANIENASYGLTMCAERVALATAVAAGHRDLRAIAVAAAGAARAMPCGACRQVLAEFLTADAPVLVARADDPEHPDSFTLGELLPCAFSLSANAETHPGKEQAE